MRPLNTKHAPRRFLLFLASLAMWGCATTPNVFGPTLHVPAPIPRLHLETIPEIELCQTAAGERAACVRLFLRDIERIFGKRCSIEAPGCVPVEGYIPMLERRVKADCLRLGGTPRACDAIFSSGALR